MGEGKKVVPVNVTVTVKCAKVSATPLEGVTVHLFNQDNGPDYDGVTNGSGEAKFDDIEEGYYTVTMDPTTTHYGCNHPNRNFNDSNEQVLCRMPCKTACPY